MRAKSRIVVGNLSITLTRMVNDGRVLFRVDRPLEVTYADGTTETVPAGRLTDFASVPRFLQPFLPDAAIKSGASVKHDWDYFQGYLEKFECDSRFYLTLRSEGIGRSVALIMWGAVALFGGKAYRRHRKLGHPIRNTETF